MTARTQPDLIVKSTTYPPNEYLQRPPVPGSDRACPIIFGIPGGIPEGHMSNAKRARGERLLSDATVRAWLRSPSAGNALHDGGGLYLRRRAGGAFWALRQVNRATGERTWAGLFPGVAYPEASLAMAREAAGQARAEYIAGGDLVRRREAQKATAAEEAAALSRRLTVRQLFLRWQEVELTPHELGDGRRTGRKDGGEWVRQSFERRVFPKLGDKPAESITRADLMSIIDDAKAAGTQRTAQVLLTDLKQMFAFAADREISTRNPLEGVKRAKVVGRMVKRTRALSDAEVQALSRALPVAGMAPRSALAIWLILGTAVRVGECMGAVWADAPDLKALRQIAEEAGVKFGVVDPEARTWHLPTTKNEREHTIHLSDFAMVQLGELALLREADANGKPVPWVFPATNREEPVCVKSFGKQLSDRQRDASERLTHRSKATSALALPGGRWTAHDLRRTAATMMRRLGITKDTIHDCLNHMSGDDDMGDANELDGVYIQDRGLEGQRQAFEILGRRLDELVYGTASAAGNVIPLRAA